MSRAWAGSSLRSSMGPVADGVRTHGMGAHRQALTIVVRPCHRAHHLHPTRRSSKQIAATSYKWPKVAAGCSNHRRPAHMAGVEKLCRCQGQCTQIVVPSYRWGGGVKKTLGWLPLQSLAAKKNKKKKKLCANFGR